MPCYLHHSQFPPPINRAAYEVMSLIASPSAWPAGWPEPNYENPVTRGNPALFVVTFVLTTIVVALRLYCRWFVVRSIGLDDTLVVAGFVSHDRTLRNGMHLLMDLDTLHRPDHGVIQGSEYMGLEHAPLGHSSTPTQVRSTVGMAD